MEDRRRTILTGVAEGRISPEEAVTLLDQLEEEQERSREQEEHPPARRVRVVGTFRKAAISGDAGVREAVARGPHVARREGDALVLESEGPDAHGRGFVFTSGRHLRVGWPPHAAEPLVVRMNPELPLEVQVIAGAISIGGVRSVPRLEVSAGSARVEGFTGPIEAVVEAGTLKARGLLRAGTSHVRCEAGSVSLHLERGSSVRVRARASLGGISLPRMKGAEWMVGEHGHEAVIGDGDGLLEVEACMGSIRVTADR